MLSDFFQKSSQTLLNLLLPPSCVHCKTPDQWLCRTCYSSIAFITTEICARCGTSYAVTTAPFLCKQCATHPLKFLDAVRAASYFEDNPMRSAIHFLKYKNHRAVAATLSELLAQTYRRYNLAAEVLIPVPLHRSRLKERGYNQSELLARQLGPLLGLPVNATALQRTRATKSQMTLGAGERHTNVADAFACVDPRLAGQRILLIDDVCTTGSTLDACAAALKAGGAASVWGLTLAKAR